MKQAEIIAQSNQVLSTLMPAFPWSWSGARAAALGMLTVASIFDLLSGHCKSGSLGTLSSQQVDRRVPEAGQNAWGLCSNSFQNALRRTSLRQAF